MCPVCSRLWSDELQADIPLTETNNGAGHFSLDLAARKDWDQAGGILMKSPEILVFKARGVRDLRLGPDALVELPGGAPGLAPGRPAEPDGNGALPPGDPRGGTGGALDRVWADAGPIGAKSGPIRAKFG